MAVDEDLELLQILRFQGVDVHGRAVVRIVGKFFPGTSFALFAIVYESC